MTVYHARICFQDYGMNFEDWSLVPAGPVITEEPVDTVFDTTTRSMKNWTTLRCSASGYPFPEYSW